MLRKRVLFIERSLQIEKLGIMYLAASLENKNVEIRLVECEKNEGDVFSEMENFRPDIVCFSASTGEHRILLTLNCVLKKYFSFLSVWGGPHATFFSSNLLSQECVDVVIKGEGEQSLSWLITNLQFRGELRGILAPDLDQYAFPYRNLLYDKSAHLANNSIKNFITMRNCPFNCSYCYNHSYNEMFGISSKNLRRRSVANVIEEINLVREQFGLEKVLFLDDNFIFRPSWVERFCEVYKKEINLPFMCSIRADMLTERLLETMKDAGLFTVNFAIETSNEKINAALLSRHQSLFRVIKSLELLKSNGITVRMQNMIGLPLHNSFEVALETLKFNLKHSPDFSWISIYQPYPKTRLGEYCIEQGFCDRTVFERLDPGFFEKSKIALKHRKRIERLALLWTWVVAKGVPVFIVKILTLLSIPSPLEKTLHNWKIKMARERIYQNSCSGL